MNLPNKLTILRVIMVPFFVTFLLLTPSHADFKWIAFALFVVASLTDLLDGHIARKYHMITNFGKFMDPLADKLLVSAALVCLTALGFIPAWMTVVIISREFIISGFRLIAAEQGRVIAAGWWGKWKTSVTMVTLAILLLLVNDKGFGAAYDGFMTVTTILLWISVILTVVSLVDYLIKNKDVMKEEDKD
ncbi:MAG: CDP-diacylglycerol--glycerol-3-phosphate 3-phosphatidyltransferase [Firmicutes bacterium]|nr:CDP-diacylglycerol--glycerol-3-phosphate 3-phosphatidyltransferase [Bacillota bacterium]